MPHRVVEIADAAVHVVPLAVHLLELREQAEISAASVVNRGRAVRPSAASRLAALRSVRLMPAER